MFVLITSRRLCILAIATEITKATGYWHTGRMDVDEELPNRILNKSPEGTRK
jgi:hypothetical protein